MTSRSPNIKAPQRTDGSVEPAFGTGDSPLARSAGATNISTLYRRRARRLRLELLNSIARSQSVKASDTLLGKPEGPALTPMKRRTSEARGSRRYVPTGKRDGGRRGACDRGDREKTGCRSDRGGNARLRPHRRAAAGQRHASSATHRALPNTGRPFNAGRCRGENRTHVSNSLD